MITELIRRFYFNTPSVFPLNLAFAKFEGGRLRKKQRRIRTIDDLVNMTFSFNFIPLFPMWPELAPFSIRLEQVPKEISQLLRILVRHKPRIVLEIGTANGGTLFLLSKVATPDAILMSIDLREGSFGGGYPKWKIPFYTSFATNAQKVFLIEGNSHEYTTFLKMKRILGDKKLDFLFIDGDHTYEGVKRDFRMFYPLVREEGIIAFHDIVEHSPESKCEVSKFWNEIKHNYKCNEIIKDRNQKWAGIGVLYV